MNATQLLIAGKRVLATGPFTISASEIVAPGTVYPKHILPQGWSITEVAGLPIGFSIDAFEWRGAAAGLVPIGSEPETSNDETALTALKSTLVDSLDDLIADIYVRLTRFGAEYRPREASARTYIAASYQGDPGVWITSYAGWAGLSVRDAADRIVMQADGLQSALERLAALRMRRYAIRNATSSAEARHIYEEVVDMAKTEADAQTRAQDPAEKP